MGRDKSTILYELKFGFGASYREKITNKSITQICRRRECSRPETPCDSELFEDNQGPNPHIRIEGDKIEERSNEASVKESPVHKSASFGKVSNRSRRQSIVTATKVEPTELTTPRMPDVEVKDPLPEVIPEVEKKPIREQPIK